MHVREWMSRDPVTVEPSTEVSAARRLLRDHEIRHLPVVECGRVVGMVSDRDIRVSHAALQQVTERMVVGARKAVGETAGIGLVIEAVMSAPVHVISASLTVSNDAFINFDDAGSIPFCHHDCRGGPPEKRRATAGLTARESAPLACLLTGVSPGSRGWRRGWHRGNFPNLGDGRTPAGGALWIGPGC